MSARAGVGHGNIREGKARGGILELQKELVGFVLRYGSNDQKDNGGKKKVSQKR